jgi:cell division protein FtsQ
MRMARNPAPARPAPLPGDVRFMNASAAVFALLAVLVFMATAAVAVAQLPIFNLRAVRVEGDMTRNSLQTIRANAMPRIFGTWLTVDLAAAKAAFEAVPWVRRAVVRRVFPNRLVVQLEEHRPAAFWSDGEDRLVNSFGEVFQANPGDVEDDELPRLQGPADTSARMLAMQQQLAPVLAVLDQRIETLELSARGSWRATLDGGAVVEIGRAQGEDETGELAERTRRFVASLPELTRRYQGAVLYADLRHRDGYALRLKNVSTLSPGEKGGGN